MPATATSQKATRESSDTRAALRVNLVSLGCPKNLVDSEMILGKVGQEGLSITGSPDDADLIVINTCGFIENAKEESIQAILEACEVKRESGDEKRVVVTGCLAQRYGDEIRREIPEVDAIIGLGEYEDIGQVLATLGEQRADEAFFRVSPPDSEHIMEGACNREVGRFRLTPTQYAYIKISEGCDNPCTFCAIPSMRGKFRSKPIAAICDEARELVATGAREIVLISQDSTSYGYDVDGQFHLPELLEALADVDGVKWIRLLYAYPSFFTDAMIDAVASIDKVVKYVDMPLQHIEEGMLRHMGRRMMEAKTRALLDKMRASIPGLYLRTTFIVGFPGEGEREFRQLRQFVEDFKFERLGVFTFSPEEGTPAAAFDGAVPPAEAKRRLDEIMIVQQENAFRHNQSRLGQELEVLVDDISETTSGWQITARSYGEAPEIDPVIYVEARGPSPAVPTDGMEIPLVPRLPSRGDFARVRITGSRGYDLLAQM